MQHYRRKLRKQALNLKKATAEVDTHSSSSPSVSTGFASTRIVKAPTNINDAFDYTKVPDEIFLQMLSEIFDKTQNLVYFSNEDERIKFIRRYTSLIDRLSYVKLQKLQWEYYHDIGITQNIWKGRLSKHVAEKYSIYYTYGRSKILIQQRLNKIEQHLREANHAVQQFEEEFLSQSVQNKDRFNLMNKLHSTVHQFVQEKQHVLKHDFEYKREILVLDATDHQLLQKFFDIQPNKSQVRRYFVNNLLQYMHQFQIISARRIWEMTKKQMLIEEDIALLEHRLTTTQSYSPSTLLDHMLNDIVDTILETLNTVDQTDANNDSSKNEIEQLVLLKNIIIQRAINTSRKMADNLNNNIQIERNKFSLNNRYIESTSEWQQMVLNTIETHRAHMIKRTHYIIQHKLATLVD